MPNSYSKRKFPKGLRIGVLITFALLVAMVGSCFWIHRVDRRFKRTGFGLEFQAKPFTGVLFDRFRNEKLRHLSFYWKGQHVWREYFWHSNGTLAAVYPYQNGVPNGEWKQWYPNGNTRVYRSFRNGVINGEYWAWHPNGLVSDFRYYEDGRELAYKSFISDGKPYYNYVYQNGEQIGIRGGSFCKTQTKSWHWSE